MAFQRISDASQRLAAISSPAMTHAAPKALRSRARVFHASIASNIDGLNGPIASQSHSTAKDLRPFAKAAGCMPAKLDISLPQNGQGFRSVMGVVLFCALTLPLVFSHFR